MSAREQLFSDDVILELAGELPTPFHLLSEAGIRESAQSLNAAYDWVPPTDGYGYINYFASKAMMNPHVQEVLAEEGMGIDASSGPEVQMARAIGLEEPLIMFTSNNTAPEEYVEAYEAGAIINLDDINQLDVLYEALDGKLPETLSFRYNPGEKKAGGTSAIIGVPEDSKFGVPDFQMEEAYRRAKEMGVEHFGIHTMVASNQLDYREHAATAEIVFQKVAELSEKLGIDFEFANLGGGLGIPYKPEEEPLNYKLLRRGIQQAYYDNIIVNGLKPLRVVTENGRHVTGPNGITVFRARSRKDGYHAIVGLDGNTNSDGPRPAIYDAYHEITVPGKEFGERFMQRVVGGTCEDNDYFAGAVTKERELPFIEEGDTVVLHDTGAHWYAMTNNYNGKLRAAEYMMRMDGIVQRVRRPETRQNLFATLDYPGLEA